MKLYSIHAFDGLDNESPTCTYFVAADSKKEAHRILSETRYGSKHDRYEVTAGTLETSFPGPKFIGYTGGGRLLKSGRLRKR